MKGNSLFQVYLDSSKSKLGGNILPPLPFLSTINSSHFLELEQIKKLMIFCQFEELFPKESEYRRSSLKGSSHLPVIGRAKILLLFLLEVDCKAIALKHSAFNEFAKRYNILYDAKTVLDQINEMLYSAGNGYIDKPFQPDRLDEPLPRLTKKFWHDQSNQKVCLIVLYSKRGKKYRLEKPLNPLIQAFSEKDVVIRSYIDKIQPNQAALELAVQEAFHEETSQQQGPLPSINSLLSLSSHAINPYDFISTHMTPPYSHSNNNLDPNAQQPPAKKQRVWTQSQPAFHSLPVVPEEALEKSDAETPGQASHRL